jgi:hypothetical protein
MELATLIAEAETLRAINTAKHKSAGKTHRIEVKVHGARGVKEIKVFYVTTTNPTQKGVQLALSLKSKVLSDFLVEEL